MINNGVRLWWIKFLLCEKDKMKFFLSGVGNCCVISMMTLRFLKLFSWKQEKNCFNVAFVYDMSFFSRLSECIWVYAYFKDDWIFYIEWWVLWIKLSALGILRLHEYYLWIWRVDGILLGMHPQKEEFSVKNISAYRKLAYFEFDDAYSAKLKDGFKKIKIMPSKIEMRVCIIMLILFVHFGLI